MTAPTCHTCGKPATCLGAYEGRPERSYGCDECCGHACEDGHCDILAEVLCELCGDDDDGCYCRYDAEPSAGESTLGPEPQRSP